jgi:protein-tyrosine phosphatase
MSDDDLERVRPLGIRTVLDLRTEGELSERGQFEAARLGASYHHLPVLESIWDHDLATADVEPHEFLAARYLDMLDVGGHAIASAVRCLAEPDALPLVFHCAAGKDRTGVVAAVVLSLLGVPESVIAHDYSLSAPGMERFQEWFRTTHPEAAERMADQPAAFMASPVEAMERFLADVARHHGSLAGYVRGLGVGDATVDAVRDNLLVSPRD